jgi:hypothetical protein
MNPTADAEPERYKGRPLLIILENYILDCIGALEPETQQRVQASVRHVFGGDSDWKRTVRSVLHLEESFDAQIEQMWQRNQQIAAANKVTLHPVQFAKMLCDQNFTHLINTIDREHA